LTPVSTIWLVERTADRGMIGEMTAGAVDGEVRRGRHTR
jgi:hypothetical protein